MRYRLYENKREVDMIKNILIAMLAVSTIGFAWLAWRNAKPLHCDNLTQYKDTKTAICEVILTEGEW